MKQETNTKVVETEHEHLSNKAAKDILIKSIYKHKIKDKSRVDNILAALKYELRKGNISATVCVADLNPLDKHETLYIKLLGFIIVSTGSKGIYHYYDIAVNC